MAVQKEKILILIPQLGDGLLNGLIPAFKKRFDVESLYEIRDYSGKLIVNQKPPFIEHQKLITKKSLSQYKYIVALVTEKHPSKRYFSKIQKSILKKNRHKNNVILVDGSDLPTVNTELARFSKYYFKREYRKRLPYFNVVKYFMVKKVMNKNIIPLQFAVEERYRPTKITPFKTRKNFIATIMEPRTSIVKYHTTKILSRQEIIAVSQEVASLLSGKKVISGKVANNPNTKTSHPRHQSFYYHTLNQSQIAINAFGRGYDCFRYYEILAYGCCLLSQPLEDFLFLSIPLKKDVDYLSFTTKEELIDKCLYYRDKVDKLSTIAKRGYEKAMKHYTAEKRLDYILSFF